MTHLRTETRKTYRAVLSEPRLIPAKAQTSSICEEGEPNAPMQIEASKDPSAESQGMSTKANTPASNTKKRTRESDVETVGTMSAPQEKDRNAEQEHRKKKKRKGKGRGEPPSGAGR
jgi:hypothetical protein